MRFPPSIPFLLVGALLLTSCADTRVLLVQPEAPGAGPSSTDDAPSTRPTGTRWLRTELFFGLPTRPNEWARSDFDAFLNETVTPRFPDGYTVLPGMGRWRGAAEECRVIVLLHPDTPDADARIDAIRAAYKRRYHQDSVLRSDQPANVRF